MQHLKTFFTHAKSRFKRFLIEVLKLDSHLPETYFVNINDSSSKIMKNAFYFILKALCILKIFKFLS